MDEITCTYDPLIVLMSKFENVKAVDTSVDPFEGLSEDEALQKHIVDGIKKNLEAHLEAALVNLEPIQIINEVLLKGMKTVGELFGTGSILTLTALDEVVAPVSSVATAVSE